MANTSTILNIISPKSVSFEEILKDIQSYIQTHPEEKRWTDFFIESDPGYILSELLAGFGAFDSFHAINLKKETSIEYAQFYSTMLSICAMLGYPVNRSSAPKGTITINNPGDPVFLNRTNPIAYYNDIPISMIKSQTIERGLNNISVVLGEWVSYTYEVESTEDFQRIAIQDVGIENDKDLLELIINGEQVKLFDYSDEAITTKKIVEKRVFSSTSNPTVNNDSTQGYEIGDYFANKTQERLFVLQDMSPGAAVWEEISNVTFSENNPTVEENIFTGYWPGYFFYNKNDNNLFLMTKGYLEDTKWVQIGISETETSTPEGVVLRTNYDGVLLVFGDNVNGIRVENGDSIVFNYIKSDGRIGVNEIGFDEIQTIVGSPTNFILKTPGYEQDGIEKLRYLAPNFHSAGGRAVTLKDHIYYLLSYAGDLISANAQKNPDTCCTIDMSYLFLDEHIVTETEEELILDYMYTYSLEAEQIILVDPITVGLDFEATVIVKEATDVASLKQKISNILKEKTMILGDHFKLGDINYLINQLDEVVRIYIHAPLIDKQLEYNEYLKVVDDTLPKVSITTDTSQVITSSSINSGYIVV